MQTLAFIPPLTHRLLWVRLRAIALVCCALLGGLRGLEAALQFDVFMGYDSMVREAGWFPRRHRSA